MKKALVTNVVYIQAKDLQYGRFYEFEVTFNNGDKGFYLSKSQEQNKFMIGQEAPYEFTPHDKWPKVKPVNPDYQQPASNGFKSNSNSSSSNFDKAELIARQSSLGHAVNSFQGAKVSSETIIKRAEQFKSWVLTGEKVTEVELNTMPDDMPF